MKLKEAIIVAEHIRRCDRTDKEDCNTRVCSFCPLFESESRIAEALITIAEQVYLGDDE